MNPLTYARNPEVIGAPDCPLIHRWTLKPWADRKRPGDSERWKLMLHHFLSNADDRDVHDHPRGFVTLVLWGRYDDWVPCATCQGSGVFRATLGWSDGKPSEWALEPCAFCDGHGLRIGDRMRPGMLRHRPASHAHRTKVGPKGCWTLVVMGPASRKWGFWREGRWWFWKDYEAEFGFAMRCDTDDLPGTPANRNNRQEAAA